MPSGPHPNFGAQILYYTFTHTPSSPVYATVTDRKQENRSEFDPAWSNLVEDVPTRQRQRYPAVPAMCVPVWTHTLLYTYTYTMSLCPNPISSARVVRARRLLPVASWHHTVVHLRKAPMYLAYGTIYPHAVQPPHYLFNWTRCATSICD